MAQVEIGEKKQDDLELTTIAEEKYYMSFVHLNRTINHKLFSLHMNKDSINDAHNILTHALR